MYDAVHDFSANKFYFVLFIHKTAILNLFIYKILQKKILT